MFANKKKLFWTLAAGGTVYGITAAKARRGLTPLLFGGIAAFAVGQAINQGIQWDQRVFGRDFI